MWEHLGYGQDSFSNQVLRSGSGNVFDCPVTHKYFGTNTGTFDYGMNTSMKYVSGYADSDPSDGIDFDLDQPRKRTWIKRPGECVLVNDNCNPRSGHWYYTVKYTLIPHSLGNGSNFLFCDGHADNERFNQISSSGTVAFWDGD